VGHSTYLLRDGFVLLRDGFVLLRDGELLFRDGVRRSSSGCGDLINETSLFKSMKDQEAQELVLDFVRDFVFLVCR
jgi:ABC-type lipopolysaccharide export system ATPase subunit